MRLKGDKMQVGRPVPACVRKPTSGYACRNLMGCLFGPGFDSRQLHKSPSFKSFYLVEVIDTHFLAFKPGFFLVFLKLLLEIVQVLFGP